MRSGAVNPPHKLAWIFSHGGPWGSIAMLFGSWEFFGIMCLTLLQRSELFILSPTE